MNLQLARGLRSTSRRALQARRSALGCLAVALTASLWAAPGQVLAQRAPTGATGADAPRLTTVERPVTPFNGVELRGAIHARIEQGEVERLTLVGDPAALATITTDVRDGMLVIEDSDGWRSNVPRRGRTVVQAHVVVRQLRNLQLVGLGNLTAKGLVADELNLTITGAGEARLADANLRAFAVRIDGTGQVWATGKATEQSYFTTGNGQVRAELLQGQRIVARNTGAGNMNLWATKELVVSLSGDGSVYHRGKPKVVTRRATGKGVVEAVAETPVAAAATSAKTAKASASPRPHAPANSHR